MKRVGEDMVKWFVTMSTLSGKELPTRWLGKSELVKQLEVSVTQRGQARE